MMQRAIHFLQKEQTIWGPISLLCTLAIAMKTAIPFDLLFLAAGGLYLCARYQIRGFCYSLAILALAAMVKHAFLTTDHLWQLGIEGSLACAFFVTALAFEQGSLSIQSLQSQVEIRKSAIENLEEEISKVQEIAQEQQIAFQEKVAGLQKELEELQVEHSSILILNEVLRKTTARHVEENQTLNATLVDLQRQKQYLAQELDESEKELSRLASTEAVAIENRALMAELNEARTALEQANLINETLTRLYARENFRVKEAEEEASSMADQLAAAHREVRRIAEPLEAEIKALKTQAEGLVFEFEKACSQASNAREQLQSLNQIAAERNFLKERLEIANQEMSHLQEQKGDPEMAQLLEFTQKKVHELSSIEPLYKQLKKQFEEKNQILHQVRQELFKTDTELQKLKMEQSGSQLNPLPKEVVQELENLSNQAIALEEENLQLQELITLLSEPKNEKKK